MDVMRGDSSATRITIGSHVSGFARTGFPEYVRYVDSHQPARVTRPSASDSFQPPSNRQFKSRYWLPNGKASDTLPAV